MIFLIAFMLEVASFWMQPSDLSKTLGISGYWLAVVGVAWSVLRGRSAPASDAGLPRL